MLKIYVGNLNFSTTEQAIRTLFEEHGEVTEVTVPLDRDTGRPRGFAFVSMTDDAAGRAAIEATNGQDLDGRKLVVNEARPPQPRTGFSSRPSRPGGGYGGKGGGGGYGGGGGGGGRGGDRRERRDRW